jgi:DNA processing protein
MGDVVRASFAAPPWGRSRRLWWLLWSRCPGIGWVRLRAVESVFGSLERAWAAPAAEFAALPGWKADVARRLEAHRAAWGADPLPRWSRVSQGGRRVLLPGDPRWPAAMHQLSRPPAQLHWKGRGSLWAPLSRRRAVAVVGTRRPSSHGLGMARRIGAALAEAGWPVVSGLAEGIDAAAHQGCLEGGGAPVAVLGTPLERVYPRHHALLQERVARSGLLITESPPDASVTPGHFACRNRLQVALAAAVVVVECPRDSGALHSADLAWRQELPLWVVPADAGRLSALGSNRLLCRGATPLLHPADLLDHLGRGPLASPAAAAADRGSLRADQRLLLEAIGGGASLPQLREVLGLPGAELARRLLELELAGRLCAEPGLRWRPC